VWAGYVSGLQMADIIKWSDNKGYGWCNVCGIRFVPGIKNPVTCGNCYITIISKQRVRAGLTPTPDVNTDIVMKHNKDKLEYKEWVREQMADSRFGRKIKVKRKNNL